MVLILCAIKNNNYNLTNFNIPSYYLFQFQREITIFHDKFHPLNLMICLIFSCNFIIIVNNCHEKDNDRSYFEK